MALDLAGGLASSVTDCVLLTTLRLRLDENGHACLHRPAFRAGSLPQTGRLPVLVQWSGAGAMIARPGFAPDRPRRGGSPTHGAVPATHHGGSNR